MKRLFLIAIMSVVMGSLFAGELDPYNIVMIPPRTLILHSNVVTNKLKDSFETKGFTAYLDKEWSDLSETKRKIALYAEWKITPGVGMPSTVTVELYDYQGKRIASFKEKGNSTTVGRDVVVATDKISREIKAIPYTFTPLDE